MQEVLIIGTGFSGICAAIKLKQAGIDDFLILEKADAVGGTWRENVYPGAECDVPTALYSYSFENNPDWDYKWAEQPQILAYIQHVVDKHALQSHIRFGQQVRGIDWQEPDNYWRVSCAGGDSFEARHVVTAVGQLHHPARPPIDGLDEFEGVCFHSAQWNHAIDLRGKRVAVIGTGASAIQFIPPVAEQAGELHVFQRGANWILPKLDKPYSDWQKRLRARFPALSKLDRLRQWLRGELVLFPIMRGNRFLQWTVRLVCERRIKNAISDPQTQAALTPDYPPGAKRILFADDYYETIAEPQVTLHTDAITAIEGRSIVCGEQRIDDIDVLILGTGFVTNPFLCDMRVSGREGRSIHDSWSRGAHAYLGLTVAGFPNFFMMYGPNTNLGHNSIIQMIEAQAAFIVRAVTTLRDGDRQTIEVTAAAEREFNEKLQRRLQQSIWAHADSWYTDHGKITNNWAGSTQEYRRRTRRLHAADFRIA